MTSDSQSMIARCRNRSVVAKNAGLALAALACLFLPLQNSFSQGSLTPPGAPAPTMKTLDQLDSKLEKRIPISSLPITISVSGSYYLTTNLNGVAGTNGITVSADNVTIDLNGFVLQGAFANSSLHGIHVPATIFNLTVLNGTIANWGGNGINAVNAFNDQFHDLRLFSNTTNGMSGGNGSVVTRCTANNNGGIGIYAGNGSVLSDCAAQSNTGGGISATFGSTVVACDAMSNGSGGPGLNVSSGSNIRDCTIRANSGGGIVTAGGCRINNCTVTSNTGIGINSQYSTISDCTVSANTGDGIQIFAYSQVIRNLCQGQNVGSSSGIRATGQYNRIEENHAMGNINGIKVDQLNNIIVKNSASGNTANYSIVANNLVGPSIGFTSTSTNHNPNANFDY